MKFKGTKGSIVALITPFHEDGSVNFAKLDELVDFHIANHTDAILALGTTGESATMTHEEDNAVAARIIKRVDGRIPVVAGSGSNCTQTMEEKSKLYESMGADALLLITPYYNKANEEGMYRHFMTSADAVNIPCILYNVPGRTGCSISVNNVSRLSRHENICGIKEASGSMSYAAQIAHLVSDDFSLYSGNDDLVLPTLAIGGSGVISVYANVMPQMCHDIVMDYLNGDTAKALANYIKYLPLMNGLFMEVNPIPCKDAMNQMGMGVGPMRLPLFEMTDGHKAEMSALLKEVGLVK